MFSFVFWFSKKIIRIIKLCSDSWTIICKNKDVMINLDSSIV